MKHIHGPVNIVKLVSSDLQKTLYIFCDVHEQVELQTQCHQEDAVTPVQFFHSLFTTVEESEKPIDFFVEARPEFLTQGEREIRKYRKAHFNYMMEMALWVAAHFNRPHSYPGVRFHYMDIRDTFAPVLRTELEGDVEGFIDDFLTKATDLLNCFSAKAPKCRKKALVMKVMENYRDTSIQARVRKLFERFIRTPCKELKEYALKNKEKRMADLVRLRNPQRSYELGQGLDNLRVRYLLDKYIMTIENRWLVIISILTDLYFLRRFLDKPYITHSYAYVGFYHAMNMIFFLVKFFSFRVAEAAHCSVSIEDLNEVIASMEEVGPLNQYLWPPLFNQCSKWSG